MAGQDEAVRRVLGLVADGRLTAAEAAPILDALAKADAAARSATRTAHIARAIGDAAHEAHAGLRAPEPPVAPASPDAPARYARIQVIENGRRAVDLRVPVGLGRFALSKVPGLSGDQVDEVRNALASGTKGPILDVQDPDGDGVRISLE